MIDIFKKYISAKNVIFFILAILTLIFITKIKDIAILFFASYVVACSLNPIVDKLSKKMPRPLAANIVLIGSILLILAFFIPIFILAGSQIQAMIHNAPNTLHLMKEHLFSNPLVSKSVLSQINLGAILSSAGDFTSGIVNRSIDFSIGLASWFVYLIAGCIIIFYFLVDKETVHKAYVSFFPNNMKEKAEEILDTISKKIGRYIIALVVTMMSVGIIMAIGLSIIKVDYPILLGLITAVFDIVPVIGPAIALIIALLVGYKAGWITMALICVVFMIAQLVENNFVRPQVFGKFLNIHPLIIYFFLFVTAQYLGVVGVILSPAIAATICVLVEELYIKNVN